jgi:membrane-bound lytic murein transglycosylase A
LAVNCHRGRSLSRLWIASGALALIAALLILGSWPKAPVSTGLHFSTAQFSDLPDWARDDQAQALDVFKRTCKRLTTLAPNAPMGGAQAYGTVSDWLPVCAQGASVLPSDARGFFESAFEPLAVSDGDRPQGLFTGYYESEARGSRLRQHSSQVPLYARPDDLVELDLGEFAPDLKGRRTAGMVIQGRLKPYPDRAAIDEGALGPRGRPLVFIDDPIDAFFMEIQGSGRVVLSDGETIRMTFAGQNGHAYTALGQVMIKRGLMRREDVTMASLRAYLSAHPDQRDELLRANRSYVFFKISPIVDPNLGPPGADGLPLTAGRSLAIDRSHHALGVPIYLSADDPAGIQPPIRRLMIAQDTGGAIRGPVRGDVFWGFGQQAEAQAGAMKARGQIFVLVPKNIANRMVEGARKP